jgi:hypothetical protein
MNSTQRCACHSAGTEYSTCSSHWCMQQPARLVSPRGVSHDAIMFRMVLGPVCICVVFAKHSEWGDHAHELSWQSKCACLERQCQRVVQLLNKALRCNGFRSVDSKLFWVCDKGSTEVACCGIMTGRQRRQQRLPWLMSLTSRVVSG